MPRVSALSVKYHHVTVKIQDNVAVTKIDQVFLNDYDRQLEATYIFPLPESAAISQFAMFVDGERIQGEMMEAAKARQIYEEFVRRMIDPALLEYVGRNTFRARVFPIPPRGEKRIQLEYTQTLDYSGGIFEYTYPLNTERFSPQPLQEASVAVEIESSRPIKSVFSPTHQIDERIEDDHHASAGWEQRNLKPDRDFTLLYSVSEEDFGVSLRCFRKGQEEGYFMLLLAPKRAWAQREIGAKDLVFVLDKSGSMQGEKIEQAKEALLFSLRNLHEDDRFGLVTFSTEVDRFSRELLPATQENVKRAVKFVKSIEAEGGTNLMEAALAGVKLLRQPTPGRPQMLVLLTDGLPTVGETDIAKIIREVTNANHASARKGRLFSFGVGYDVNTTLLDKLAEENGGAAQYVKPEENLEMALSRFYSKVSHPVLANLQLDCDGVAVKSVYPSKLPDLFAGSTLTLFGRYSGEGESTIRLSGETGSQRRELKYSVTFPRQDHKNSFVPLLWANRRVGDLLAQIREHGEAKELVDEVVKLALRFGIMTPYTSFLVQEHEAVARDAFGAGGAAAVHFLSRPEGPASMPLAAAPAVGEEAVRASVALKALKEAQVLPTQATAIRHVGDKTFYLDNNFWVDVDYRQEVRKIAIKYGSEAYFALLALRPELGQYLALGRNVTVMLDGLSLSISETGGVESLSAEEADAIRAAANP